MSERKLAETKIRPWRNDERSILSEYARLAIVSGRILRFYNEVIGRLKQKLKNGDRQSRNLKILRWRGVLLVRQGAVCHGPAVRLGTIELPPLRSPAGGAARLHLLDGIAEDLIATTRKRATKLSFSVSFVLSGRRITFHLPGPYCRAARAG